PVIWGWGQFSPTVIQSLYKSDRFLVGTYDNVGGYDNPDVDSYIDAAISAKYISIPTIVCPALDDKCVAPAGQFCVANSIPEKYKMLYILDKGHAAATDRDKELMEEVEEKKMKLFYNEI
ncbi:MAG: hypothetical protein IKC08_04630, partial [Lentisphaeria bacterium]|nr:hypothetical protein [Lentisphaeria bacterium]